MVKASVIVPARDAEATLPRTLRALAEQDADFGYEVIVVDDGSSDRTVALARDAPGPVSVVEQRAQGPAAARNLGVARAGGDVLAFCDADVYPTPGWLRAGADALGSADLVQGHVLPDPTAHLGPFDRTIWITLEAGLYETASLFTTRKTFERVGGFEEWLRPGIGKALAEDVWFGWKARRLGARTAFCAEALAHHAVFPRGWREYAGERRRLRYFPAMAAKMPELRRHFLYRRAFLNKRSATFDLAIAAGAAAVLLRSPFPLVGTLPYAHIVRERARPSGRRAPVVAAADAAADVVGLYTMAVGSVRYRSPVL